MESVFKLFFSVIFLSCFSFIEATQLYFLNKSNRKLVVHSVGKKIDTDFEQGFFKNFSLDIELDSDSSALIKKLFIQSFKIKDFGYQHYNGMYVPDVRLKGYPDEAQEHKELKIHSKAPILAKKYYIITNYNGVKIRVTPLTKKEYYFYKVKDSDYWLNTLVD